LRATSTEEDFTMFMARPINLKVEVWDRIDEYLNKKAEEDRSFKPNRSLFLEEAAIFFLDAQDKPAEEEAAEDEDSFDFGSSGEDSPDGTSSEETSDDDFDFDFDLDTDSEESADSTEEPSLELADEAVEEEPVEEEPKPKKKGKRK
jgi:hypothetical protein